MRCKLLLFFFLNLFLISNAQQDVDTIYVCNLKTTYIAFKEPIKFFKIGTNKVQIEGDKIDEKIITLQSIKNFGKEFLQTNLFVLLETGKSFYFNILFNNDIDRIYQYNIQYKTPAPIATDSGEIQDRKILKTKQESWENEDTIINFLKKQSLSKKIKNKNQNVIFFLSNIYYFDKNDKIYTKIGIENNSNIDYEIDFIKFYRRKIKVGKKFADQENEIFADNNSEDFPKIIMNEKKNFIFSYDKFTLENNEFLLIEVKEKNGERNLRIEVPHYFVAYPLKISVSNKELILEK